MIATKKLKKTGIAFSLTLLASVLSSCGTPDEIGIYCENFEQAQDLLRHQKEANPQKRTIEIDLDDALGVEGAKTYDYVLLYEGSKSIFSTWNDPGWTYKMEVRSNYKFYESGDSNYAFRYLKVNFGYRDSDWWLDFLAVDSEEFANPHFLWEGDEMKSGDLVFATLNRPEGMSEADVLRLKAEVLDRANESLGI